MSKLIALVATAVVIGGERTIIQPGEPLPDLGKHDERELLRSGAAEDPADTLAQASAEAGAAAAAEADFAAARKRQKEEAAALTGAKPKAPPAGTPAAKK